MDDGKTKGGQIAKTTFVFSTVFFCLGVSAFMGFDQNLHSKVSETVADGLISLAMFVAVSYLAAQTVDTSGILNKVSNRLGPRGFPMGPPPPMYAEPVVVTIPDLPPPAMAVEPCIPNPEAKG